MLIEHLFENLVAHPSEGTQKQHLRFDYKRERTCEVFKPILNNGVQKLRESHRYHNRECNLRIGYDLSASLAVQQDQDPDLDKKEDG